MRAGPATRGSSRSGRPLYDYGAELVLAGHDHHYERFAPQDGSGQADAAHGVREIIVGTGGAELHERRAPRSPTARFATAARSAS